LKPSPRNATINQNKITQSPMNKTPCKIILLRIVLAIIAVIVVVYIIPWIINSYLKEDMQDKANQISEEVNKDLPEGENLEINIK
jgi:hypothetical protein